MTSPAPKPLPLLYVKTGCPYCTDAIKFLSEHGIGFREVNVTDDANAFSEMQKKSKQTKAPTLDWNGKILADFGIEELVPFLQAQNVKLEDS
jgi:glutaredoxin 3